ncbi:acyltransferase [Rouxiella sp. T17]|uniref:acyltransferase family protein n=1 Tax=Rouxiella sp. T17 TaxID=3085684 RepID=UPI002FCC5236
MNISKLHIEKSVLSTSTASVGKVIFADQLRAFAFLCVVVVHWLGIYSLNSAFISVVTGAPKILLGDPDIYKSLLPPLPYFNFGPFGVSIFFLISGFVIPYSLKNKSKTGYIASRLVRIYPTYIACSFLMLLFTIVSHAYWGSELSISLVRFISNITLTSSLLNYESIDYVNWTLSIEVKFYLICLLVYSSIRNGHVMRIVSIPFFIYLVVSFTRNMNIGSNEVGGFSFDALKIELTYASFMFLGILINLMHSKKITIPEFLSSSVIVAICFAMSWRIGPQQNQFIASGANYFYGYLFFIGAYLLREHFIKTRMISFLSNVSYSFYALHSIIGYCIIRFLTGHNVNYPISVIIAFAIVLILSYTLFITIEKKCISIGKKIV